MTWLQLHGQIIFLYGRILELITSISLLQVPSENLQSQGHLVVYVLDVFSEVYCGLTLLSILARGKYV